MTIGKKMIFILVLGLMLPFSASAGVTVYAEGAYTEADLVVYIYTDITTAAPEEALLSYGVNLSYDPSVLGSPAVEKNNADWYFGDKASPYPTSSATLDTTTPGQVIILDGKLDPAAPQEGVSGNRVLLAKVSFTRLTATVPSVELYLGKGGSYANFVQVNGVDLDKALGGADEVAPIGTVAINQRGDANGDGVIDIRDLRTLRQSIGDPDNAECWVDCNGDGVTDIRDVRCLRQKI